MGREGGGVDRGWAESGGFPQSEGQADEVGKGRAAGGFPKGAALPLSLCLVYASETLSPMMTPFPTPPLESNLRALAPFPERATTAKMSKMGMK
jgi:hypothetical protein